MGKLHYLTTLPLIAAAASLPASSDALGTHNILLSRHSTGCSHSANWQNGEESSTNRVCNNSSSLSVVSKDPAINKTDCQALVQQISGKAGTGHWDIQWNCDGTGPNVLGTSGGCGFAIDQVTESNENTITPQDVIGFIKQVMDMFPNDDTMGTMTGNTTCNSIHGQTIAWRVGPNIAATSAGVLRPSWSWLCLVGTVAAGLSLPHTL